MLADLSPPQLILAEYMSSLSEEAFLAQWMLNLEFDLWRAVTHGPYKYGQLQITNQIIDRLMELSFICKGWIRFDDICEEAYVPIDDWLEIVRHNLT